MALIEVSTWYSDGTDIHRMNAGEVSEPPSGDEDGLGTMPLGTGPLGGSI